jgi:hypothetical protein
MRRGLVAATVAMLLVALVSSAAMATGNNKGRFPSMCWDMDAGEVVLPESEWAEPGVPMVERTAHMGGVQVFSRINGKGAQRILCSGMKHREDQDQATGFATKDWRLDTKQKGTRKAEDIWNGMRRNIDSYRIYAPKGCDVNVRMWTRRNGRSLLLVDWTVWNAWGSKKKLQGFNFCPRWDNTVTKVRVATECPGRVVDLFE